ncbi:MAG: DegV family protein [Desulfurispora sp.]|uniref:DegV family protein n=1 Tax=Desulfurispora sp. TaxID=3014275 RepID=UPI00404B4126
MSQVKIITDSAADLPAALQQQYDVEVVPLYVTFEDGQTYLDGVDINPQQFAQKLLASRELPKTSRPNPETFAQSFQRALSHYRDVIYVGISSKISGTVESAQLAARQFTERVHVWDSRMGSLGIGILALKAAELARQGLSAASVLERLQQYRQEMNLIFTMDSLENLIKGGRVSRLPGFIGNLLDIKPVGMATLDGQIKVLEKIRGRKKSLQRLLQLVEELGKNLPDKIVGITHLDCLEEALQLKESIQNKFAPRDVLVAPVGSTIGTYGGKGCIVISF